MGPRKKNLKNNLKGLCCWCLSKRTIYNDSDICVIDANEPYEYIIEKLAIKKVPVSLFYASQNVKNLTENDAHLSVGLSITNLKNHSVFPRSSDLKSISFMERDVKENEISNYTLLSSLFGPREPLNEAQSRELVAKVLHKHSSLYTLDTKDRIPKDPLHLPVEKVVVPKSVKNAIMKNRKTSTNVDDESNSIEYTHNEIIHNDMDQGRYKKPVIEENASSNCKNMELKIQQFHRYLNNDDRNESSEDSQSSKQTTTESSSEQKTDSSSEKEYFTVEAVQAKNDPVNFVRNCTTHPKNIIKRNVGPNIFTNENVKTACNYDIYYNRINRNGGGEMFPLNVGDKLGNTVVLPNFNWLDKILPASWYPQDSGSFVEIPRDELHGRYILRRGAYNNPIYMRRENFKNPNLKIQQDKFSKENENNEKKNSIVLEEENRMQNITKKNSNNNHKEPFIIDEEHKLENKPQAETTKNQKWKIIIKHNHEKMSQVTSREERQGSSEVVIEPFSLWTLPRFQTIYVEDGQYKGNTFTDDNYNPVVSDNNQINSGNNLMDPNRISSMGQVNRIKVIVPNKVKVNRTSSNRTISTSSNPTNIVEPNHMKTSLESNETNSTNRSKIHLVGPNQRRSTHQNNSAMQKSYQRNNFISPNQFNSSYQRGSSTSRNQLNQTYQTNGNNEMYPTNYTTNRKTPRYVDPTKPCRCAAKGKQCNLQCHQNKQCILK